MASRQAVLEKEGSRRAKQSVTPDKKGNSKTHNRDLGKRGEDAASKFLYNRGYDILERNWRCKFGEADIIARDGDAIVFVEVKTRSGLEHGFPAEAVDHKKQERYERIALAYISDIDDVDIPIRFDVVSIVAIASDRALIRHHINAFSAI